MKTDIKLKLLAPLSHFGDGREGITQVARTLKFEYEGEFVDIPVFTGNAFRGITRRLAMKDYLDRIGITEEGINAKLYHMMFTGGSLTGGGRFVEIGQKREMRKMCPPLSLFGSAIGDQIQEGKMKVGIFKPICMETKDYTDIESDISFYDMQETVFYTRRDDTKSTTRVDITEEFKSDNPVQMKYEMQGLSAGTELVSSIVIENANEIEVSCLKAIFERFAEVPFIGGKSSVGHGEVIPTFNLDADSSKYYSYIEENKEDMKKWVREMEGLL